MRWSHHRPRQAKAAEEVGLNGVQIASCSKRDDDPRGAGGSRPGGGSFYRKAETMPRVLLSTRVLSLWLVVPMGTPLYSLFGFDQ
jgi:hypothetical protein